MSTQQSPLESQGLEVTVLRRTLGRALRAVTLGGVTVDGPQVRTSITDAGEYLRLCAAAASRDWVFRWFRSHPVYRAALEHVSEDQGRRCLELIGSDPNVSLALRDLIATDAIGLPRRFHMGDIGRASPTTLRYIKVLVEMRRLFGDLDGRTVAEIGVGFGGQARILTSVHRIPRYIMFDLPPALDLADRFLREYPGISTQFDRFDGRAPVGVSADIAMSNYAFSELEGGLQEQYLDLVLSRAPRGYMLYNHTSPPEFRSLTAQDVVRRIPGAEILDEDPLTRPGNVLVIWGRKGSSIGKHSDVDVA